MFLVALILHAAGALAAIFDEDDRLLVADAPISPYSPIGRVYVSKKTGHATGFLVSNCHVLTAQHVFSESRPVLGKRLYFRGVLGGERGPKLTSRGIVVASGNFHIDQLKEKVTEGRGNDWMLIRLDKCLGESLGFVDLDPGASVGLVSELVSGKRMRSAGFPNDRLSADDLMLDPSCSIRGGNSRELMHDCAALPGSSGSPIFEEVHSGGRTRLRVIAMITAAHHWRQPLPYREALSNRATATSYLWPIVETAISSRAGGIGARTRTRLPGQSSAFQ